MYIKCGISLKIGELESLQLSDPLADPGDGVLDVVGPHVLGGIHPEAHRADVEAVLEVAGDHVLDVIFGSGQVIEAHQVAVPDLGRVAVVLDLADWLVEVQVGERHSRVTLSATIK